MGISVLPHLADQVSEEIEILDKDIQGEFRMFWNCLQQGGYLHHEEETLAYMEDVLRRYHNTITWGEMGGR